MLDGIERVWIGMIDQCKMLWVEGAERNLGARPVAGSQLLIGLGRFGCRKVEYSSTARLAQRNSDRRGRDYSDVAAPGPKGSTSEEARFERSAWSTETCIGGWTFYGEIAGPDLMGTSAFVGVVLQIASSV